MRRTNCIARASVFALAYAIGEMAAVADEPLLRQLPPGLFLKSSTVAVKEQVEAIGKKLGGEIEQLTNSILQVHGRMIKVNVIAAKDEPNAKAIHAALTKIKAFPFCLRKDLVVVEYVGADIDVAIATKTSYELGLLKKPSRVRYRIVAELATIDAPDYMACDLLFNRFLALNNDSNEDAIRQIRDLSTKFKFGRSLVLRDPQQGPEPAMRQFQPPATRADAKSGAVSYVFDQLPNRHGVPYVTATMEVLVDDTGLLQDEAAPADALTAATQHWPADDPAVVALAQKITAGKSSDSAKATAILEWLAPGKNIKYSGQSGSRWGTAKVLEQKFGHCWDFSDCFVTLCRAANVPSRQVAGWLYGTSGHAWAEFYRDGEGWQQVDPTGGGKLPCGVYHIPYFTSEDGEMPIVYVALPQIEAMPAE